MDMENLKSLRTQRGMTQQRLAEQSGVTQGTISALEKGRQRGTLHTYERLARALGVSLSDFFNTESKPSPKLTLADLLEPATPVTELPAGNWSPTRLGQWLRCPAQGAWSTGVFDLPDDFQWPMNERAKIGKAVHRYAETRLQGMTNDEGVLAAADETVGLDPELWLSFTEAWEDHIRPTLGTPQAMEQRLEVHLGGHVVTAVLDVVDQNGMIRDLKTTQRLPNPQSLARESLQAPMYVAAWHEKTGETAPFALDYLAQHKNGVDSAQFRIPVSQADVDRVIRQLDYAAELAINPDRIIPNPLSQYGCSGCAFLSLCHEKFGTFLETPAQPVVASV